MSDWKTIRAPKMLYLPVEGADFDHSGQRVEPSDKIRILPGTNQIEINGVPHKLMRNIDDLIDAQGNIQLAKPAPPVKIHAGGRGRASVAGIGGARLRAKEAHDFDLEEAKHWEGDAGTDVVPFNWQSQSHPDGPRRKTARGFPIVHEGTGEPVLEPILEGPAPPEAEEFFDDLRDHMAKDTEPSEMREVTLRDGSKAQALFSTVTGRQIGTPQRNYQAAFNELGHQEGNPTSSTGPNPTFDMDEYRRLVAQQQAAATIAPTARERHDAAMAGSRAHEAAMAPPQQPAQQPPSHPTTSLGSPHLDNLVGAACGAPQTPGAPLGHIFHLVGPADLRKALLQAAGATFAENLTTAIGSMFLLKHDQAPLIVVEMNVIDAAKLADDLPAAATAFEESSKPTVLVISTPDIPAPRLMGYICRLRIDLEPHPTNDRFVTAKINDLTASFPAIAG